VLKFKDANGRVKFVLTDEESQPVEVETIADEILREWGIKVDEEEEDAKSKKKKIDLQGIDQDDAKQIKGVQ
jgi:hypothetical protein